LTIFSDALDLLDGARESMHRGGKLVSCLFHAVRNGFCAQQLPELWRSILHVLRGWHLAAIAESSQHAIVEHEARTCCQIRVCVFVRVCACARYSMSMAVVTRSKALKHAPPAMLVSHRTQRRHETSKQLTILSQSQCTQACHSRCQACIRGEKLDKLSTKCKELCRSRKFLKSIVHSCDM
jgi:hypothetical protein